MTISLFLSSSCFHTGSTYVTYTLTMNRSKGTFPQHVADFPALFEWSGTSPRSMPRASERRGSCWGASQRWGFEDRFISCLAWHFPMSSTYFHLFQVLPAPWAQKHTGWHHRSAVATRCRNHRVWPQRTLISVYFGGYGHIQIYVCIHTYIHVYVYI